MRGCDNCDALGYTIIPKTGVWIVREGQAMRVEMPEQGEWFISGDKVREIIESEMVDRIEDEVAYTIWVKRDD